MGNRSISHSMEYNTSQSKLVLPEYGRNIQKMVEHITTIKDREERNQAAKAIIQIMGTLNPQLRDINDFKHKLWDHLAIISDFKLDIDYPYELPKKDNLFSKPKPIPYNAKEIKYKHYGRILEMFIEKAASMEEGPEKSALIEVIANHMKKSYLIWNKDNVSNEQIMKDLNELSKGRVKEDTEVKLSESRDLLSKGKKKNKMGFKK